MRTQVFGFTVRSWPALAAALLVVLIAGLSYHRLLTAALNRNPEPARRALQEHCRFETGKRVKSLGPAEFEALRGLCDQLQVTGVDASGGISDPVFIRVEFEGGSDALPFASPLIFRTRDRVFTLLPGWVGLMTGSWDFDGVNAYSQSRFDSAF